MATWPTHIVGGLAADRAVAIAGLLAERGVQTVLVRRGASDCRHHARKTDLPAVLAATPECELHMIDPVDGRDVCYRVTIEAISRESP